MIWLYVNSSPVLFSGVPGTIDFIKVVNPGDSSIPVFFVDTSDLKFAERGNYPGLVGFYVNCHPGDNSLSAIDGTLPPHGIMFAGAVTVRAIGSIKPRDFALLVGISYKEKTRGRPGNL